jgi:hypothetical protein
MMKYVHCTIVYGSKPYQYWQLWMGRDMQCKGVHARMAFTGVQREKHGPTVLASKISLLQAYLSPPAISVLSSHLCHNTPCLLCCCCKQSACSGRNGPSSLCFRATWCPVWEACAVGYFWTNQKKLHFVTLCLNNETHHVCCHVCCWSLRKRF